ncbi:MAG: histidine kinase, partial [Thermoanaerobacterales bacterium]|nr:histidine kinase [Thermoanaerobacterales bacterium]
MISKDLITLVIIFTIILAIGVSVAETRVNSSLGLDVRPK